MDFSVSPQTQDLIGKFRAFVKSEVMPLEARMSEPWAALGPALRELRAKAKAAGLWAPQLSRELGGLELPLEEFALVSEELGRSPLGYYAVNCQAPDSGNMELMHQFGTDAQKDR